jgi:uncharacterized SAM-binding protein YcdF (DUF218 family)
VFYYVSKIAWFFATPSNLLISLVLLGLVLALFRRLRGFGIGVSLVFTLATIALGLLPIASYILLPLEERFPTFRDDGRPVDGIVLLGGSVEASDSVSRGMIIANESAERVLETIQLAHRYPNARILISGGGGTVFGDGAAEAPVIANYFKSIGIEPARILVEDRSRTTAENATFSRELAKPQDGERWLLVTSAWHMPRAVGVFRRRRSRSRRIRWTSGPQAGREPTAPSPSSLKVCAVWISGRRSGRASSAITWQAAPRSCFQRLRRREQVASQAGRCP